jgi:RAB6A-GEF complex partner protein 1
MYWPIGTPRIYATTTNSTANNLSLVVSHDGLSGERRNGSANAPSDTASLSTLETTIESDREAGREPGPELEADPETNHRDAAVPITPGLPTPATPGINSIEHEDLEPYSTGSDRCSVPIGEPIVALKVSRTGHLFAAITASTLTIWQTKVRFTIPLLVITDVPRTY